MLAWAFEPAEENVLQELIAKGRKDAEAWALASEAAESAGGRAKAEQAQEDMRHEQYPSLKG